MKSNAANTASPVTNSHKIVTLLISTEIKFRGPRSTVLKKSDE